MVRVLAVSDVVEEGLWADIGPARGADLILGCGDLPFEYLGYLMNALDVPLVFVPGNHDPDLSGYRVSRGGLMLRAVRGAYLDLLRVACERLEVAPLPAGDLISQAEIYRAEAALRGGGLDVRETASR